MQYIETQPSSRGFDRREEIRWRKIMEYGGRAHGYNGAARDGPRQGHSPEQRLGESRHSSVAAIAPADLSHHKHRIAVATQQTAQNPLAVSLSINVRCVEHINTRFDRELQAWPQSRASARGY